MTSQRKHRNLQGFAALHRALMGIYAGNGSVERRRHVDAHLVSRHENRSQEVIRQIRMRTSVVTVVDHARRQTGTDELQPLDERVVTRVAIVTVAPLRTETASKFAMMPVLKNATSLRNGLPYGFFRSL